MSGVLQTILAASLIWLATFVFAAWSGSLLFSVFRATAKLTPPHNRSGFFVLYALLPALASTAVTTTLYFPGLADMFLPAHCHSGDCAAHAPQFAVNAAYGAMYAAIGIILIGMLFFLPLRQLLRHSRKAAILKRLSTSSAQLDFQYDVHIVENDTPLAWCDGLIRPRVFVSRGLLEKTDSNELEIVLAHERAHAERRDNLARLLIDWSTRVWPSRIRRNLFEDFGAAIEHACDYAAASGSEPEAVSRVIQKLGERHAVSHIAEQRLEALANSTGAPFASRLPSLFFLLTLCLVQAYLFARAAHPIVEWFSL